MFFGGQLLEEQKELLNHTLLDVRTAIPVFMHITPAIVHHVNGLDFINYESGGYYIIDLGYIDFDRMSTIDKHDSFYVIRLKANLSFVRVSAEKPDKKNGFLCDQRIKLKGSVSLENMKKNENGKVL